MIVAGTIEHLPRAVESRARLLGARPLHEILSPGGHFLGSVNRAIRADFQVLAGLAETEGLEGAFTRSHGELKRRERPLGPQGFVGAHLHLERRAQDSMRTVLAALLDLVARLVDHLARSLELGLNAIGIGQAPEQLDRVDRAELSPADEVEGEAAIPSTKRRARLGLDLQGEIEFMLRSLVTRLAHQRLGLVNTAAGLLHLGAHLEP